METCNVANAKFMAESLLSHAREICRYAKAYCEPSYANLMLDEQYRLKFTRNVDRMIKEMSSLLLLAGNKGVDRFCNREQIEAYMDEARLAIAAPASTKQSAPLFN